MSEYAKEYYQKNKERLNKLNNERYHKLKDNPEQYEKHLQTGRDFRKKNLTSDMHYQAKKRAKEKGLEFNIEISDIILQDTCPVLNIPMIRTGKRHDGSPSLDRIDNSKGYIKGNIAVISWRANALKKDATLEEMKLIIKYMSGE